LLRLHLVSITGLEPMDCSSQFEFRAPRMVVGNFR
jgi:hypothetical protein